MPDSVRPRSIADLPPQTAAAPETAAQGRARFFNPGNAFNVILPAVPDVAFTAEPARALDPATPTGLIPCDISDVLECPFPATSPFVLASYGRIRAGESLAMDVAASGIVHFVIDGVGSTVSGDETIAWSKGDVFITPGGVPETHTAGAEDAVLWIVTNEPQFAFERAQAPAPGTAPTPVVHYPAAEIQRQVDLIYDIGRGQEIPGAAVIMSSDMQVESRNALPTLTVAMNTLDPGVVQRPHRHNSVAVSLVVSGTNCYSKVDGRKKMWSPYATTITQPVAVHSHHNEGDERAFFLIVQDGGLFYHARAMGFAFVDA
jgi:gentisate 1,2-dioxygenase